MLGVLKKNSTTKTRGASCKGVPDTGRFASTNSLSELDILYKELSPYFDVIADPDCGYVRKRKGLIPPDSELRQLSLFP